MRRRARHYAHLLAATDLSQSLRSALEFGAGVAALMLVTAFAANSIQSAIHRSQTTEAFSLTSAVKVDLITHRAVHGEWPTDAEDLANSALLEPFELGLYVDRLELGKGGALTAIFDDEDSSAALRSRRLTYRPTSFPEDPSTPIVWVCSRHRIIGGLESNSIDRTNIEPINLPSVCREY